MQRMIRLLRVLIAIHILKSYQNQRRVIVRVASIDIDTLGDLFLTDFQIAPTASTAEVTEWLTEIQRVVILDSTFFDQLLFIV